MPLWLVPLLPCLGAVAIVLAARLGERAIHRLAITTSLLFSLSVVLALGLTLGGGQDLVFNSVLFRWEHHVFRFSLGLDRVGSVFLLMTAWLGGLVVRFSQYYMHREPGQGRFFSTLLLFLGGMSTLELAQNLETLLIGWEIVGISSFVLIGFYRHRENPVRNALKVYCIYRLCDTGLLLATYLQHELAGSSDFAQLNGPWLTSGWRLALSLLLLLSAAGKSAQFPFSFWVSRAMEGPTPSSAIFYGALSIHAGVFLLLRTAGLWQSSGLACLAIGLVGLTTAVLASAISHVQSNVKAQIAYASVAQVGLMFVELASGFHLWALFHFVGNASLRCYQLLISPSAVVYLLRQQSTAGARSLASDFSLERLLPNRIRSTLFVLATQEGYMEKLVNGLFFNTTRWFARNILGENRTVLAVWTRSLAFSCCAAALLCAPHLAEGCVHLFPFLGGIMASYGVGVAAIFSLPVTARLQSLDRLRGLARSHPVASRWLFVSFLGMSGFPISPAFFGEDLLLSSAMHKHYLAGLAFTFLFIVNGIVLARTFTRFCLGKPGPECNRAVHSPRGSVASGAKELACGC